jgi:DNA mismatch repair protein MutS
MRQRILYPLADVERIERRLDVVESLLGNGRVRDAIGGTLGEMCDIPRVFGRVASAHAGPRDLVSLRRSLELAPEVCDLLAAAGTDALRGVADALPDVSSTVEIARAAIAENPPGTLKNGGVIRRGYNEELDRVRGIASEGKGWIGKLQAQERERTKIPSLKIGYNKVFGYYLEVTKPHVDLVPEHWIRKQTLVNAERYVTPELKERESTILTAEEDILRLERELFDQVCSQISEHAAAIQSAASVISSIDVSLSLAECAAECRYVRPELTSEKTMLVRASRHPVVERLLLSEEFVPNDIEFDEQRKQILLITGPNMAGKSTYLRQTALVAVMAQMGSFVPADSARLGIIDRVFTRIGATDALARGRSTFLVEMSETAAILHEATDRSLILLDEIGRGTSTFDGLSIAWAVTEYLHDRQEVKPWTMFATHYHELTELGDVLPRLSNLNVLVKETEDSIVFLRRIAPGAADQSYGIEVARLAGIPAPVIRRAREVLDNLEDGQYTQDAMPRLAGGRHGPLAREDHQLPLFEPGPSAVEKEIEELELERMTPLDAFDKLIELRKRVKSE